MDPVVEQEVDGGRAKAIDNVTTILYIKFPSPMAKSLIPRSCSLWEKGTGPSKSKSELGGIQRQTCGENCGKSFYDCRNNHPWKRPT